jgi:sentrin-specific protease 1
MQEEVQEAPQPKSDTTMQIEELPLPKFFKWIVTERLKKRNVIDLTPIDLTVTAESPESNSPPVKKILPYPECLKGILHGMSTWREDIRRFPKKLEEGDEEINHYWEDISFEEDVDEEINYQYWLSVIKSDDYKSKFLTEREQVLSNYQERFVTKLHERFASNYWKEDDDCCITLPAGTKCNDSISMLNFDRFFNNSWLSDENINFYLRLIEMRNYNLRKLYKTNRMKIIAFNSFFINHLIKDIDKFVDEEKLHSDEFCTSIISNMSRSKYKWMKNIKLGKNVWKIFIPIHIINHWTLICINFETKGIVYYDSLGSSSNDANGNFYLKVVCIWLQNVLKEEDFYLMWRTSVKKNCPQQSNSDDCGVFCLVIADYLSDDLSTKDRSYAGSNL